MSDNFKYLAKDFESIKAEINEAFSSGSMADYNTDAPAMSNLVTLLSESADLLSFYLNKASEEAHISTSNLYENVLNRSQTELSYQPKGFIPPTVDLNLTLAYVVSGDNGDELWYGGAMLEIPRYTNFRSEDNHIYSIPADVVLSLDAPHLSGQMGDYDVLNDVYVGKWMFDKIRAYEGTYRKYVFSNPAQSPQNEYVIKKPDNLNISHGFVDVYVLENGVPMQWTQTTSLMDACSSCRVYELKLNSTLDYVLTFGDGVHGMMVPNGDEVIEVFALLSSPTGGTVDADNFTGRLQINTKTNGYDVPVKFTPRHAHYLSTYKSVFNLGLNRLTEIDDTAKLINDYVRKTELGLVIDPVWKIYVNQPNRASEATDFETLAQIRTNAPEVFSYQGLIMTAKDLLSYMRADWYHVFHDITVMNNWQFMTTYGSDIIDLSGANGFKEGYRKDRNIVSQMDSCDFNNVYIIGVPKAGDEIDIRDANAIKADVKNNNLKTFNYEIVIMKPMYTYIALLLDISKDEGVIYQSNESDSQIVNEVHCNIIKYFTRDNCRLGQSISKSDIRDIISGVAGVDYINSMRMFVKRGSDFVLTYNGDGSIDMSCLVPYEVSIGVSLRDYEFPVWSQSCNSTLHKKSSYIQISTVKNRVVS